MPKEEEYILSFKIGETLTKERIEEIGKGINKLLEIKLRGQRSVMEEAFKQVMTETEKLNHLNKK